MYGQELDNSLQQEYADKTTDITRVANGLTETGRQQAALGMHIGGLGLRHIKDIAIPAALAAKITARPKVIEICNALSTAGIIERGRLTQHLDANITGLPNRLRTQLHQTEASQLPYLIAQITTRAQQ